MRILKWFVLAVLVTSALAYAASGGQTIGPAAMEFKGPKARGTMMVRNDGLQILQVTIQPQGFDWTNGKPHLAPLPEGFQFATKQRALILGPRQQKFVDFKAQCATLPCHFYVTARFETPKVANGLNSAAWLPVVVYLCPKKGKGCRLRTLEAVGVIRASTKR
jgi:hypothetical protein